MSMIEQIAQQVRAGMAENNAGHEEVSQAHNTRKKLLADVRDAKRLLNQAKDALETGDPVTTMLARIGEASLDFGVSAELFDQATDGSTALHSEHLKAEAHRQQQLAGEAYTQTELLDILVGQACLRIEEAMSSVAALRAFLRDPSDKLHELQVLEGGITRRGEEYLRTLGSEGGELTGGYDQ